MEARRLSKKIDTQKHTHTHTHTHTIARQNGHNSGSECQNPRQLDHQTRQSMSDANSHTHTHTHTHTRLVGGSNCVVYSNQGREMFVHRKPLSVTGQPLSVSHELPSANNAVLGGS